MYILDKNDYAGPNGHIFDIQTRLCCDAGLLEAEAGTEAEDDLVADPFGGGDVHRESGEEAGTDGHKNYTHDDKNHIIPKLSGPSAGDDGTKDLRQD